MYGLTPMNPTDATPVLATSNPAPGPPPPPATEGLISSRFSFASFAVARQKRSTQVERCQHRAKGKRTRVTSDERAWPGGRAHLRLYSKCLRLTLKLTKMVGGRLVLLGDGHLMLHLGNLLGGRHGGR